MSALPASFSYFANKLAGVSRKTLKITPNNSTTIKQNENCVFVMPTDSIVDLTSLRLTYNFKYQNAPVTPANATCRYVPAPHQLVRSASWSINNQVISGSQNQNFSAVYEALRVASSGNDNVNSRVDEYNAPPIANLIGRTSSKIHGTGNERLASDTVSRRCQMTDFLGLQTATSSPNWDTAVCGETRLELQMNGNEAGLVTGASGCASADADWEITDAHILVDVISFASPEYDMLMSAMLQEGSLLIPYNEITSQKSLLNSNIRFNVASSSLDMVGFTLLKSNSNLFTNFTQTDSDAIQSNFTDGLVPNQVQLCYRKLGGGLPSAQANMSDAIDATWYFTINGQVYPQCGATKLIDAPEFVKGVYAKSKDDYNQLFLGASTASAVVPAGTDVTNKALVAPVNLEVAKNYKRVNYLERNCFVAVKTCLDTPACQNERHAMSGINTLGQSSQISLSLNGFNNNNDFCILIGQGSSVLQVGAGQQVAVIN